MLLLLQVMEQNSTSRNREDWSQSSDSKPVSARCGGKQQNSKLSISRIYRFYPIASLSSRSRRRHQRRRVSAGERTAESGDGISVTSCIDLYNEAIVTSTICDIQCSGTHRLSFRFTWFRWEFGPQPRNPFPSSLLRSADLKFVHALPVTLKPHHRPAFHLTTSVRYCFLPCRLIENQGQHVWRLLDLTYTTMVGCFFCAVPEGLVRTTTVYLGSQRPPLSFLLKSYSAPLITTACAFNPNY